MYCDIVSRPADSDSKYNEYMSLKELSEFLISSKHNCTANGKRYYMELEGFVLEYFGKKARIKDITFTSVNEYIEHLKPKYKLWTVAHRIKYLKQLSTFAYRLGATKTNVLELLDVPKPAKTRPKFLSDKEIPEFLKVLSPYDKLPCLLSLHCGLRKSEILSSTWDMVDFDQQQIVLPVEITKSRKTRYIPMSDTVKDLLLKHMFKRPSGTEYVILNKENGKRNDIRVQYAFREMKRPDLYFHCLRKTFATMFITKNPDQLYMLMEICGWESLQTAKIYLGETDQARKLRIEKVQGIIPYSKLA